MSDTYKWDTNGNLTEVDDKVGDPTAYRSASRWMGYDDLDRLEVADSAAQPPLRNPWSYSWGEARFEYDGLDNIRTFKMGRADFTYGYDGLGRLQSLSQRDVIDPLFSYDHNARGQMSMRETEGRSFLLYWDSAHRLTRTSSWNAGVSEAYRYDAHGHRVKTERGSGETVYQVYTQGGDLLWERTSNGVNRKYARIGGRLIGESINGSWRAIQTDVIGSVRQMTNAMGTKVHEDIRAPYGSTMIGWEYQNGPSFTGHMEDGATRLTYMKARYYDPVAMRFISPDPVYVDLGTGGNFNRYWYANNNPYTYVDPDGKYARGPGFSENQWKKFNRAQGAVAGKIERALAGLNKAMSGGRGSASNIAKFEKVFGAGSATEGNMRAVAGRLEGMLSVLRDDGSMGPPIATATMDSHGGMEARFNGKFGETTPAAVYGRDVFVNSSHDAVTGGMTSDIFRQVLAHESAHSAGVRGHAKLNYHVAYRFGEPHQKAGYSLLNTFAPGASLTNPDHIVEFAW